MSVLITGIAVVIATALISWLSEGKATAKYEMSRHDYKRTLAIFMGGMALAWFLPTILSLTGIRNPPAEVPDTTGYVWKKASPRRIELPYVEGRAWVVVYDPADTKRKGILASNDGGRVFYFPHDFIVQPNSTVQVYTVNTSLLGGAPPSQYSDHLTQQ